jgi:hypothetical protein
MDWFKLSNSDLYSEIINDWEKLLNDEPCSYKSLTCTLTAETNPFYTF